MLNINGYILNEPLKSDNSGYAKWGFAKKDGFDVFVKEFLSPVYPLDGTVLSGDQILRKREICRKFENDKTVLYNELNKCATGNIITVLNFFRFDSKYYVVTEKVDAASIDIDEVACLDNRKKLLMVKIILHSINTLHQHGIVHGDIKPDNVLLKRTPKGMYTAKIIDFDSSFLEENPPESDEEFQGDMVYLAPESFMFIAEEDVKLTRKVDVFALGILLHQYYSGELPGFDTTEYDYLFEAVLDGCIPIIDPSIPEDIRNIIAGMLVKDPESRMGVDEAFAVLSATSVNVESTPADEAPVEDYVPLEEPTPPKNNPTASSNGYFSIAGDLF